MKAKFGEVKKLKHAPFVCVHKNTWKKVITRMRLLESHVKILQRIMAKWDI